MGVKLFYVEFDQGATLVRATDRDAAEEWCEAEFGRSNGPYVARRATDDDEAHVLGFGGMVHEAGPEFD